jgi:hypothetical protein
MGLFGRRLITCPICNAGVEAKGIRGHWDSHVQQIPPGHGDASGQYTWECVCGPADMKWPRDMGAKAGLVLHMRQRHNISF